jgi:hypothetical protein
MDKPKIVMLVTNNQGGGAAPATYSISGTVYDADGSTAVSGATVALGAASTTSGVDGTYSITGLAAGASGSLTCTKSGYSWTAISVASMAADLTGQNFSNVWWAVGGIAASCVAAYKAKGAASYAASKVNLANPGTYDCANGTAYPTWAAGVGWTFVAASSQYLDTGITGITKSYTLAIQLSNVDGLSAGRVFGADEGNNLHIYPNLSSTHYYRLFGDSGAKAGAIASGNLILTNGAAYKNGSADGTWTSGAGSTTNSLYLGGSHSASFSAYTGNIVGFAIYSTSLNSTQAAALAAVMAAF